MNQAFLLIAAYFGLMVLLSVVAIPYRRRLRKLGAELCAEELVEEERGFIESMMRSAYSWRVAVILLLVYGAALFQSAQSLDRESEELARKLPLMHDPRIHLMMDAHLASALAVNPLFGLLALLARYAFYLKARIHHNAEYASRVTDLRAISVPI